MRSGLSTYVNKEVSGTEEWEDETGEMEEGKRRGKRGEESTRKWSCPIRREIRESRMQCCW